MIDSREKLETWLKEGPIELAQVIAARAVLRALPYAFTIRSPHSWVERYSLSLFRATAVSWAERNFLAQRRVLPLVQAADAAAQAADAAADADAEGMKLYNSATAYTADAAAKAVGLILGVESAAAAATANHAILYINYNSWMAVWNNLSAECDWLAKSTDPITDTRRLTREPLWSRGVPEGWHETWQFAEARLVAIDPTYQVWTDWYNRRIEGHDASFDIPGDTDRTEDKKILARLADATNEDFWSKGATYVNTTLQSWIDEAHARVAPLPDFAAMQRRVAAGAIPRFGSDDERNRRAALLSQIEALSRELELLDPLPAPIGHNRPPLELDEAEVDDAPAVVQEMRVLVPSLATEIAPATPDPQRLLSTLLRLGAIVRWVGKKADLFADEAVKKAGMMAGATAGAIACAWLVTRFPAMQSILRTAAAWLEPLIPLL